MGSVDLNSQAQPGRHLRELLRRPGGVLAPGVYDGISAQIARKLGFDALYMTGFGVSATLGYPDIGLTTLTEMAASARQIADVTGLPVIADGDTGYGNPSNVYRTVREYERAGVAAIQLEDQVFPKRCGHMSGKEVVPVREHVEKIQAAVKARTSKDFLIIARTDARAPLGLQEAIRRAQLYEQAGADVIFVEAPQSEQEMAEIRASVSSPLMANMVEFGKTPLFHRDRLIELGYQLIIFPVAGLFSAAQAIEQCFTALLEKGTTQELVESGHMMEFNHFTDRMGLAFYRGLEQEVSESDRES